MELDITRGIQAKGMEMPFDLTDAWEEDRWNGDPVVYARPVRFSGTYTITGDTVLVQGTAQADLDIPCARCLEPARVTVKAQVDEAYVREREEKEKDPWSDENTYTGHIIHLDDQVRTAILQEVPTRVLCKPDCLGLCPQCGTNLNQRMCSCQKDLNRKSPFSAFANLLNEDEEV